MSGETNFATAKAPASYETEAKWGDSTLLLPHQQRVIDEKAELDTRKKKLMDFCVTEAYCALDEAERRRLHAQYHAMESYSYILGQRIAAFPPLQLQDAKGAM